MPATGSIGTTKQVTNGSIHLSLATASRSCVAKEPLRKSWTCCYGKNQFSRTSLEPQERGERAALGHSPPKKLPVQPQLPYFIPAARTPGVSYFPSSSSIFVTAIGCDCGAALIARIVGAPGPSCAKAVQRPSR